VLINLLNRVQKWRKLISWLFRHRRSIASNHDLLKSSLEFRFFPYFATESEIDSLEKDWKQILNLITPREVIGHSYIRLGSQHDGGYCLIDDLDFPLVSIGIGNQTSLDHEFCKRNQSVFQFDHTIIKAPNCCSNPLFFKKGLGPTSRNKRNLLTLKKIQEVCNLTKIDSAILKIDIEGSEWVSLLSVEPRSLLLFRQIVIEFHGMDKIVKGNFREVVISVFEKLNEDFSVGYVNANNFQPILEFANLRLPHTFEVSFFKRSLYSSNNRAIKGQLAYRNNSKLPPAIM
jgi:hypothetical protein